MLFVDKKNISLDMLNKSGLHFNEYGTTRLVNNFYYNMSASRYEICIDTQNTTKTEDPLFAKNRVNKKLVFNVYNSNTNRPVNSAVDNNKSLSKTNSVERRSENYAFPSGVALRLQKNITIIHLNLISLRNKISCGMKC